MNRGPEVKVCPEISVADIKSVDVGIMMQVMMSACFMAQCGADILSGRDLRVRFSGHYFFVNHSPTAVNPTESGLQSE